MMLKLGKQAPKLDPRTLLLANYLDEARLPSPPALVNRSHLVPKWGMMLNDELGDCTCASLGHMVQLLSTANDKPFVPSDADVLKAYENVGGYVSGHPETDNGASMLDAMNYWRHAGLGGHGIDAFAKLATRVHVRLSVWMFGAVNAGVQLPLTANNQIHAGQPWAVTDKNLRGDASPGSWGGHSVPLVDYNRVGPVCITWGRTQQMTWKFWDVYADEAYVPLSPDWVAPGDEAPSGFDIDQLIQDLKAL